MNAAVAVIGESDLADRVCAELSGLCRIIRCADFKQDMPEATDLALVLHDAWHPSVHREAEDVLQSAGIPWLRGFVAFGEGVLGPLVRPGMPGCSRCADMRHLIAGRDRREIWGLQQQLAETGGIRRDVWASRSGLAYMALLLAAESQKLLQGERSRLEENMIFIDMKTLSGASHCFLPDPQCPVCGRLPADSAEGARIVLQPSPKLGGGSYRSRSLKDLRDPLLKDYLDYKTGFLNSKMFDLVSPFADVNVNLPMFALDEAAAGRTHSYAESELTAMMEGLERYCGMAPRGKRTVVMDSYRNLLNRSINPADRSMDTFVLNPASVGLYTKEQYERPGFPYPPFDPDLPMEWVWGYSFMREAPVLVPQILAYYNAGSTNGFVYETSNGCALGGSLEEAIFYGMMEVVERDSFLLTWYAKLPLPRLDLASSGDTELELMVNRLQTVAGYDTYVYNATMENGIPSVWVIAKNKKPSDRLHLICAAGAHPDPVKAVKGALHELSGMMLTLDEKFAAGRELYERMVHEPSLVREMEDHSMLYGLPQMEERLQFLLDENRPLRTFAEQFKPAPGHSDLTDDLKEMLKTFRRLQLDVIVVDQTTPELRRNGLSCVKVLIPGMLPMSFGYDLTRLTGLNRVLTVPAQLGYAERPLRKEQLNPHPHPFP
ncbi:TOMM precursor leader peptide-binding protein [Paenibacillus thalictri]|uniref:TOMM leader peptide-binding protein n=1 Tax=Paenibacillus thalictri TaxID=2527873 RepID=A0A4Q9DN47_9BACL|nr:TOMM precursor leader peptide-binding protein [Paenibacillus thalictri]TBL75707.1 TOMM precursor leader peptide-binding protein [Paenibacillus thalictri]